MDFRFISWCIETLGPDGLEADLIMVNPTPQHYGYALMAFNRPALGALEIRKAAFGTFDLNRSGESKEENQSCLNS